MMKKSTSKVRVKSSPPRGKEEKPATKTAREKPPKAHSAPGRKAPLAKPVSTKTELDTDKRGNDSGAILSRATGTFSEMEKAFSAMEKRIQSLLSRMEERMKSPLPAWPHPSSIRNEESDDVGEVAKMFSRSLSDLLDRKLEELIPSVAGLYHQFQDELRALQENSELPDREDLQEFLSESMQKMGRILQCLGGGFISPQVGEPYDPVIHLAVGETEASAAEEGTVAGVVRPGYKSGRGRVVLPARVLVGTR